ncbi:MAG: universal stress protein [Nitrospirae bacterium]|nr:universal stress protein [Nitrospirota bacterium]
MRILVAIDGREYSLEAARFLNHLDLTQEDEIRLLHVINFVPLLHEVQDYSEVIYTIKQEVAPKILDEALEVLKPLNVSITTSIAEGDVVEEIIRASEEGECDLIVVGSKGLRGLKSILIGSVARDVVSKATLPVLVIRQKQWDIKGRLKILFATDGSEYADSTAEVLQRIPFPIDTEITILHVVQSAIHDIPERFYIEIDDRMKDVVAEIRQKEFSESSRILDRATKILSDRYSNLRPLTKVGDPSTEILSFAENTDVDIIVTGCRGHKGIRGLLGSVSRDIMRYASMSVLIVKRC